MSAQISVLPIEGPNGVAGQIYRLIQSTGRHVDDVASQYFNGIHQWLPIVSRSQFHDSLIRPEPLSAKSSILLLSIYMIVCCPERGSQEAPIYSVYLSTKMLLAQAQAYDTISIHLIQAGVLCAVFEYAQCRAEAAHLTIGTCARMALAAGIDRRQGVSDEYEEDEVLGVNIKRNLWWSILLLERFVQGSHQITFSYTWQG